MNVFMHFSLTSPHKQQSPPRGCHIMRSVGTFSVTITLPHRQRSALQFTVQQTLLLFTKAQQLLYSQAKRMKWYISYLARLKVGERLAYGISKGTDDVKYQSDERRYSCLSTCVITIYAWPQFISATGTKLFGKKSPPLSLCRLAQ